MQRSRLLALAKAGRGFAVVAREVKALASQTAKATEEIGAHVTGMQNSTTETAEAIREIIATIGSVSGIAAEIATAVETQGEMTREIVANVGQAATGTAGVRYQHRRCERRLRSNWRRIDPGAAVRSIAVQRKCSFEDGC